MKVPLDDFKSLIKIYRQGSFPSRIRRDTHLAVPRPYLGVGTRQDFGVEIRIPLSWGSLVVRLTTYLDLKSVISSVHARRQVAARLCAKETHPLAIRKVDHLHLKGVLDRPQMQTGEWSAPRRTLFDVVSAILVRLLRGMLILHGVIAGAVCCSYAWAQFSNADSDGRVVTKCRYCVVFR